ncbi:MAG: Gfo/Idh/MocA family oxidoreductase [Planctomycetota bacterium]
MKTKKLTKLQVPNRRTFLKQAGITAGLAYFPGGSIPLPFKSRLSVERRQMALIGVGGNGTRTAPVANRFAELVALCDVDSHRLKKGNEKLCNGKATEYSDYREILNRDDIDIVQISTPDHWHAKILIEAMLAGKDAYCEKPLTLTVDEGKLIRQVQKETGRVVQVGTQERSSFRLFNKALAVIADGRLGRLKKVTCNIGSGAWSPELPVVNVPKNLDWDRWLGPSTKVDYRFARKENQKGNYSNCHNNFRWWYQFSGGKLTDWGAHHIDIGMLGIAAAGQNNNPVSVEGTSKHAVQFENGKPLQLDRFTTAQQFNLVVKFEERDVQLVIKNDGDNGILFEGDEGRIFVNRGKLAGKPIEQLKDKPLPQDAISKVYRGMPVQLGDRPGHWANFMHAIDNQVLPISDVHSHMKMLNVCHLAGICCRLSKTINWDQATEQITGDELANSMLRRDYREGYEISMTKQKTS